MGMKGGAASALRMAFAYTIQADFEVSSTETSQRSWPWVESSRNDAGERIYRIGD
jgi:hypothetical protein